MGKRSMLPLVVVIALAAGSPPGSSAQAPPAAAPDSAETPAASPPVPPPWRPILDLESLLRDALAASPEIAAARDAWRAEEEAVPAAAALQDPVVGIGVDDQPFDDFGAGRTMVTLSQSFAFPGKRGGLTDVARGEAGAARWRGQENARRLVTEIKVGYFDLFRLEERLRAMREIRANLDDAAGVAKNRYETGTAGQQDLLLAQVDGGMLDGEIVRVAAEAGVARDRLALLAGRREGDALEGEPMVSPAPFDAPLDTLLAAALEARPSLRAAREDLAAARAAENQARIAWRPDLEASAALMAIPNATDEWRAELGFTVPLWKGGKQDAVAREMSFRAAASEHALASEERRVAIAVRESYARVVSAREAARLTERVVIPAAELAYRSARANYLAGRESFIVVLESLRRLIDLRKIRVDGIAEAESEIARLEMAVGRDLGEIRLDPDLGMEPAEKGGTDR